jgi:hypothetical protein
MKEPSLWKYHKHGSDMWSTQAYLINKVKVKSYIDSVVRLDVHGMPRVTLRQPRGIKPKCRSSVCLFPHRIVADIYLYIALGKTYTIRLPLFNGGKNVRSASTIQSPGVEASEIQGKNHAAFRGIDTICWEMRNDSESILPPFVRVREKDRLRGAGFERIKHVSEEALAKAVFGSQ